MQIPKHTWSNFFLLFSHLAYRCIRTTHLLTQWRSERLLVVRRGGGADALLLVDGFRGVHGLFAEGGFGTAELGSDGLIDGLEVGEEAVRDAVLLYFQGENGATGMSQN